MGKKRDCRAPVGSSVTGCCCLLIVGAPHSVWLALFLCSATWTDYHKGLEYVGAGPQREAPEGQRGVGDLGSQAPAAGWAAGVAEGVAVVVAVVAARARRAALDAQALLPGYPLQRGGSKTRLLLFVSNISQCPIYAALPCS